MLTNLNNGDRRKLLTEFSKYLHKKQRTHENATKSQILVPL